MRDSGKPGKKRGAPQRLPVRKPLQDRALRTRDQLVSAARRVFARDGFDLARLEDIASAAGKTRGALYAHFRDKEDLFFALIEQDIERDAEKYVRDLGPDAAFEDRVAFMTGHIGDLIKDRRRMLLYLEFKMYVIRHTRRQKRLAKLHREVCQRGSFRKLSAIPEIRDADETQRRRNNAIFGVMIDGLAMSFYFDPEAWTEQQTHERIESTVRERLVALERENRERK